MRVRDGLLKLFGLCVLAGVLVAGLLFPAAGALGVISNRAGDTVSNLSAKLVTEQAPLVTTVTDRAGNPIAYLFKQNRTPVTSDQIADTMKAAMVAIEDQRFFEHEGVDWPGTVRAALSNQFAGKITQGASTITQQYVKNYLVHVAAADNPVEQAEATEQTIARKLREIRIALQLEKRLSKEEILTRYLNVVPFGSRTYGVAAAARTYFETTPDKLTIPQAALLAGIVNKPGALNPVTHPEDALFRRNLVIDAMARQQRITPEAAQKAREAPLGIVQPLNSLPNGCVGAGPENGFFCKYVIEYLERAGFSREQLERGGYTIRTTLDQKITAAAHKSAQEQVPPKESEGITNVMTVVEPGTKKHAVRALVTNRNFGFDKSKGETAYAWPSSMIPQGAGSVYKTFVAAAALEEGMGINNVIPSPASYTSRVYTNGRDPYTVSNAEGVDAGPRTLQMALATSPNTAFVALQERVGLDNTVDMAARLGMRKTLLRSDFGGQPLSPAGDELSQAETIKQNNFGPFTLGFTPTSPLELANVSATISSGGVWCPPTPIKSIVDRHGNPVSITESPCEQAVDEELANALFVGMSKDTTDGTAVAAAKDADWTRKVAAKTGTTESYESAAFIGATAHLAGSVLTFAHGPGQQGICLGNPPRLCGGGNIYGGTIPAHTWMGAMKPVHEGLPTVPLPPVTPRYADGGSDSEVPNVVGMNAKQATKKLRDAGYKINRQSVSSSRSRGLVISQSPRGSVPQGKAITISVSTGYIPPPQTHTRKPSPEQARPPQDTSRKPPSGQSPAPSPSTSPTPGG
ncbi:membrane peptidoglycan carboxypeptidase [Halopolyspora algeriensis]|uniref:Membrane peptidoglycan carboxypeptidase n=1 Tax=Halopolyspora algeriensis TaxID=1500506 RepID=A0A368VG28_9ACTN|nr:penicillin-binding protein [Halopolyspora algeriensis]RCW40246.1 membrane peptidoglycan carboxypeptidase [Halopolyspora algeriensis]TQM46273.1 membrane peptidoglycan carboxypeptidase [Halopolyspora algeriensis]